MIKQASNIFFLVMPPSTSSSRGAAARLQGAELEDRVARAYSRAGRTVTRNVILIDSLGLRSEVDIIIGPSWWPWRTFIECKAYHTSGSSVGLEDVAKFKEVMSRNGVRPARGLFITTTSYVPRARSTGVRTLDGKEWLLLEGRLHKQGNWIRAAPKLLSLTVVVSSVAVAIAYGADGGILAKCLADSQRGWKEGLAGPITPPPPSMPKTIASSQKSSFWSFFASSSSLPPFLIPTPPPPPPAPESFFSSSARSVGTFARTLGVRTPEKR